jgi:dihydrofolate synthase/folylpolyglutamate synthase
VNTGDAFSWLDAHVNLESLGVPAGVSRRAAHPTLERMEALVALLGSPQVEYPVLHLTGTNGKTSVARIARSLLVAHGVSTGSYTSPHLERVNERIAWDGEEITDEELVALLAIVADIEPHLPAPPSYFEILTGTAFRFFADVAAEVAVVEVGMGGGWDATNVADGELAMVTNVSLDHLDYFGPTRVDIAAEKAGIVKPGSTLVLGETDPELVPIFMARGPERVVLRDHDFGVTRNELAHHGRALSLFTPEARYEDLFLSLHGAHQADNAVIALAAVEVFLGRPVDRDVVSEVFGAARSPGRLEVVGHQPLVLLDGAHNVAGAQSLAAALADEFPPSPRVMVVGLLREKDPTEMLEAFDVAAAHRLICCRAPSARARDPHEIAAAAVDLGMDPGRIEVVEEVAGAVERALELAEPDQQVVVTGTLYVVGAARAVFSKAGTWKGGNSAR